MPFLLVYWGFGSRSPRYSITINFLGRQRQVDLIVIYDSLEALGTIQVQQVLPFGRSDRNPFACGCSHRPIPHSMNFLLFYGTFYVELGKFSAPKLEGKIPLLDIFVEEKEKSFSFENTHILMPAFWAVNIHRNQRG